MSDPAPISAVFVTYKPVQTRGVGQLIFEVPMELFHSAVGSLGGPPLPGREVHVAIVRLAPGAFSGAPVTRKQEYTPLEETDELKLEVHGVAAVRAAGALCKYQPFQEWLLGPAFDKDWSPAARDLAAVEEVYRQLGIKSRKELRQDMEKLKEWRALQRRFEATRPQP